MIFPIEDIAQLARETTHAHVGALLYGLRDTVDQLIAIRVREFGPLLDGEYDELMAIKGNLEFLLSDIKESMRKLKVVR